MSLKTELEEQVAKIFRERWEQRDGTVVPSEDDIKLSNDGVNIEGTVLYADMADSTVLVDNFTKTFAAEIYKTFLHCAARIIAAENGTITAYDGDRIMAIYLGGSKNTSAVRSALKINYARLHIVTPAMKNVYKDTTYSLSHVVGVDTSKLFVARTGIRGSNDLVWVGSAANHAAKLTALSSNYSSYITPAVFTAMADEVKFTKGVPMWASLQSGTVYGSTWYWGSV